MEAKLSTEGVLGVWPQKAVHQRARFFAALTELTGVRVEPVDDPANTRVAALLRFGGPLATERQLETASPPTLVFAGSDVARVGPVEFTDSVHLNPSLRGQTLSANWSPDGALAPAADAGYDVLASGLGEPIWWRYRRDAAVEIVSVDVPELGPAEQLRHRFRPGQCLGLIALLQFLKSTLGDPWNRPEIRACFLIDDPNTRRPVYGHIDYAELAEHAEEHDYQIAFAQIPLDLSHFDPATVALFRRRPERLSLALHGNNHTKRELATSPTAEHTDRVLAQALRRAERFEARAGVGIARVMVPPHGRCSELVLREMARVGFESVTLGMPTVGTGLVDGFGLAEVSDSKMPVLVRRKLFQHDHALLAAFLGRPIILYGHEPDFCDGLEIFERGARLVNRMEDATWVDLAAISRSNFMTRRDGDVLTVRPGARRLHVVVEQGIREVVVEPIEGGVGDREDEISLTGHNEAIPLFDSARSRLILVDSDEPAHLDLELVSPDAVDVSLVPDPGFQVSPLLRRWATTARDRSHPMRRRISRARR